MREIKFRVWDKKERKFRLPFEFAIDGDGVLVSFEGDYWRNVTDKDRYEISFYTGLKDKNGKEIYEGDVIRLYRKNAFGERGEIIGAVTYIADDLGYALTNCIVRQPDGKTEKWDRTFLYKDETQDLEIIGNVYENPELSEIS